MTLPLGVAAPSDALRAMCGGWGGMRWSGVQHAAQGARPPNWEVGVRCVAWIESL